MADAQIPVYVMTSQPPVPHHQQPQLIVRVVSTSTLGELHDTLPLLVPPPPSFKPSILLGTSFHPPGPQLRHNPRHTNSPTRDPTTMQAGATSPAAVSPNAVMLTKNPLPLSAYQEGQVRDIYYARVRGICGEEIKRISSFFTPPPLGDSKCHCIIEG